MEYVIFFLKGFGAIIGILISLAPIFNTLQLLDKDKDEKDFTKFDKFSVWYTGILVMIFVVYAVVALSIAVGRHI